MEVLQIVDLLAGFARPWYIAGGWAVDLYLGRITRPHRDVEIAIFRQDQQALHDYLAGWQFEKIIPGGGPVAPWDEGEWLELPVHEIHARRPDADPSALEILLNEADDDNWRFRRNPVVARPLVTVGLRSAAGVPYLVPEVVLLYKANNPRPDDEADFHNLLPAMGAAGRDWLKQAIAICHPAHPWLNLL